MTEQLDLLLIHPAAAHGIYGSDLAKSLIACEPPLWCRLIAGYVRDRGFTVKIIDAEAETSWSLPHAAAAALEDNPRLICIAAFGHQPSASTQQMHGARNTAAAIKYIADHRGQIAPIIMVGGHVAALPVRTLEEEPIDYACNGEGPATIAALLHNMTHMEKYENVDAAGKPYIGTFVRENDVPGLVYFGHNGEITQNKPAPLIPVDELHGKAWDLLPMHAYRAHNWQCFDDLAKRQPYASIYTTLGCPYRCSFCCIQSPFSPELHGNTYRMRKPADVVAEMLQLHRDYGVTTFKIIDELFVLNPRHYGQICNMLIDTGLGAKINIWAYARIDTVKQDKLDLLRRAGVKWLALGIESGSKHVRDGATKSLRNDDIVGVVKAIEEADIHVIGNYIFGLPDDTLASMQATLDLSLELNTAFANFYSAMAYPGSDLYAQALVSGATLPETWAGYSQHNDLCRPLDTEHVSAKEVLAFRDRAFDTYFTNPAYLAMVEAKFGPETLEHVKQMTTYKLKRKLLTGEIE